MAAKNPLAAILRHSVEIQQTATAADTTGDPVESWSTYKRVRAAISPLSGREFENAQRISSDITTQITLRYETGITTEHRIKFGSRYFNIHFIKNVDERDKQLILLCSEDVD